MAASPPHVQRNVPLAPLTTLELGGPAAVLVTADRDETVAEALRWAARESLPVAVLGAGSNTVVADAGSFGMVLRPAQRGIAVEERGDTVLVSARAGEPWDDVVTLAASRGWAGVECLAGIPGTVGATPIQNVGAYGQDVGSSIAAVRVLDRVTGRERTLDREACAFAYRSSVFRREPDRFVVLAVTFAVRPGGSPTLAYAELARLLAPRAATPTLADVRAAVLELRRSKSMLIAADDPNRRSVGSFFVNPTVSGEAADAVVGRALAHGAASATDEVPRFVVGPGRVKLSAAWLIEHAGFARGFRRGPVGLSTRHALALVHHGGGTTAELLALAGDIRSAVHDRFEVTLHAEPAFLGFASADPLDTAPCRTSAR